MLQSLKMAVFLEGGGGYTRETGTIWQIRVLTAEWSVFLGPKYVIFGRFALRFQ